MTVHYFVRHVVSEFNIERKLGGNSPIHPRYGKIQLNELSHYFAGLYPHLVADTIYTSPLLRCAQTAEALARDLGKVYGFEVEIEVDESLKEQNFGVKEGTVYKDQDSNVGKLYDNKFKGADKPADVVKRVTPFVKKIDKRTTPSIIIGSNLSLRTISSVAVPESSEDHYVRKWRNGDVYIYNNDPNPPIFQLIHAAQTFESKEIRKLRVIESMKNPAERIMDKRHGGTKKRQSRSRGDRAQR